MADLIKLIPYDKVNNQKLIAKNKHLKISFFFIIVTLFVSTLICKNQSLIQIDEQIIKNYVSNEGQFTQKSLAEFLGYLYFKGLISNIDFKEKKSLFITNIYGTSFAHSLTQLFKIRSLNSSHIYILKELKYNLEAPNLISSFSILDLQQFIKRSFIASLKNEYPILIFPSYIIKYQLNKVEHFLSLMPCAPGVLLQHLLEAYCKNQNERNEASITKAIENIAKSLARFHKHFMVGETLKTLVHGDFHPANILFEEKTELTYFIDNIYIAKYFFNRADVSIDFKKFFSWTTFIVENTGTTKLIKKKIKHTILKLFLKEYLSLYNLKMQKLILNRLLSCVNDNSWYYIKLTTEAKQESKQFLSQLFSTVLTS